MLNNFPVFLEFSFLSDDLCAQSLVKDFKKKISFLYQNINDLHEFNAFALRSYYLSKSRSLKGFLFLKSDFSMLSNLRYQYSSSSKNIKKNLYLSIPIRAFFYKLRVLGFIHLYKLRPIGNVNYISFDDWFIIKSFGFLAYCFLSWFRFCGNFSKLKYLVEIIRQSCFLTLSRKHNKSKTWAYSIYTSELIISNNLFLTNSYFPSKNFSFANQNKFYFFDLVYFNPSLFLEE